MVSIVLFYGLLMIFKSGMKGNNQFGRDPKVEPRKMDDILDSSYGL